MLSYCIPHETFNAVQQEITNQREISLDSYLPFFPLTKRQIELETASILQLAKDLKNDEKGGFYELSGFELEYLSSRLSKVFTGDTRVFLITELAERLFS